MLSIEGVTEQEGKGGYYLEVNAVNASMTQCL